MTSVTVDADWCVQSGPVSISGTHMEEVSRESEGIKWCFHCRKRHDFWWVVMAPTGFSYYGPSAHMKGINSRCSDLFPGWYRKSIED